MSAASSSPVVLAYAAPMRRRKPVVWPVYLLIALNIAFAQGLPTCVGAVTRLLLFHGVLSMVTMREVLYSPVYMLAMQAFVVAVQMGLLLPFVWFSRRGWRSRLDLRRPRGPIWAIAALCLVPLGADVLYSACVHAFGWQAAYHESVYWFIHSIEAYAPLTSFGLNVLVYPVFFSLTFQGFIQSRLIQRHGAIVGLLITSAAAALMSREWTNGLNYFVTAFLLGTIAYQTGSVCVSMLALMVLSATGYAAFLFPHGSAYTSMLAVAGASVVLPLVVWLLLKMRRPVPRYLKHHDDVFISFRFAPHQQTR